MPNTNQGGGYTLTFSKKNKDVEKILFDKKKTGIVLTDYICDAIRAFENSTNNSNFNINNFNIDIEKLVREQVALALEQNNSIDNKISLESDLDDIDIDDD